MPILRIRNATNDGWITIDTTEIQAHALVGASHTASGLTAGHVLRATGATTFAFQALQASDIPQLDHGGLAGLADDDHSQYLNVARHDLTARHALGTVVPHDALASLTERAHASLTGVGANDHHAQSHALAGSDHTASGLTAGWVLRATGATTFAWQAFQAGDLPKPLDLQSTASTATLGSNLIANGDFATGDFTNWTPGAGWSVVANQAVCAGGSGTALSQNISVGSGSYYVVYFDYTRTSGYGLVSFAIGANVVYANPSNGTNQSVTISAPSTGSLAFSITPPATAGNTTFDNIRVYQVSAISTPVLRFYDTGGALRLEFRSGGNAGNGALGSTSLSYIVSSIDGMQGTDNLAIGSNSLENTTTGYRNIVVGTQAGRRLTHGIENTVIGYGAAIFGYGYTNCVVIGSQAMRNQIIGGGNVAIGYAALYTATYSGMNVAVGYESLKNFNNTTLGGNGYNTAVGTWSLTNLTTGQLNVGVGAFAGNGITTSSSNVCVGYGAGQTVNKSNSVLLGREAGYQISNGSVCIGYQAGYNETGANKLYIANSNTTTPLIYGAFDGAGAIGVRIYSPASTAVAFSVRGAAAQSANLQEWQDNAGAVMMSVGATATLNARSILPTATDNYNLGAANLLWSSAYISSLNALVFAEQTIQLLGGWLIVAKDQGDFAADVASGATTIDFGKAMTVGHFVLVRAHDTSGAIKAEYIQVGTLVSGTTYNVTRDLAGANSPDPAWAKGTPFVVLGTNGSGRIELNAYDTPRISIVRQGATYNAADENIRLGDLNGLADYATETYGAFIGDYAGNKWLAYDPTNGLRVRGDAVINGTLSASKLSISQLSAITADLGTITAGTITGATIRTAASGARIQMNSTELAGYASDGTTKQFYLQASDGKAYAGAGNVVLSADGIRIEAGGTAYGGTSGAGEIAWTYGGAVAYDIGTRAYTVATVPIREATHNLQGGTIKRFRIKFDDTDVFKIDTNTATTTFYNHLIFSSDNTYDIGAGGANRPRDVLAGRDGVFGGALTATGKVRANDKFNVNGTDGASSTITVLTDYRIASSVAQMKTRSLTYTGGIVTSIGAESGWTDVPIV